MFVNAIEEVGRYTRPIHTISRIYNDTSVTPGAATLFFVNESGVAVTCKHVINLLGNRQAINEHYNKFRAEKNAIGRNNKYKVFTFLLAISTLPHFHISTFFSYSS